VRCEGVYRAKDGQRIDVDISTSAIQLNGKTAYLCVSRDITEQKRLERRAHAQFEIARIIAFDEDTASSARAMLQVLCEAFEFDVAVLWQTLKDPEHLSGLGHWAGPNVSASALIAQSQICAQDPAAEFASFVFHDGQARATTSMDKRWAASARWQSAREAGLQQVVACPIHSASETIGVIELWTRRTPNDEASIFTPLQTMANQVGQFLDHKRIEKELRDTQALHVSLVRLLPQNIFRKDRMGRFTFGNVGYCASLKLTLAELLGKTDFDLFPTDVARKYVADDQRIMQSGQSLDTIEEHFLPDGKRLYVHVVKTPVYDAEYEVVGVQGIFWDVTHEVLAHEAIAHSEKRYRQLAEAAMDGIVVIDDKGKIILFNPAAERMFGYRAAEILGDDGGILVPREFQKLFEHGVRTYWRTRVRRILGRPQEFNAIRKDGGEFPVEVALSLLADPDEANQRKQPSMHVLAAIRDLSERNKMRSFMVQNEKLASIGLLSAGVAHEINNPLAFVANNLVVLQRDCAGLLDLLGLYEKTLSKPGEADSELASRIETLIEEIDLPYVKSNLQRILSRTSDGIARVSRIVQSLRGMARTDTPHRQDARLPDLINSSLEIIHGKFKHLGIIVEQKHDANPVVSCVAMQISQVILNLLVNAFQAIGSLGQMGGRVVIETKRLDAEMLLRVQDNGPGIPPEYLGRLFDPFFTTKDVGEGTGLGLSISHHIITAHGGRIEVESQAGEGAAFRVYLPLKERKKLIAAGAEI
jgi:PAS domain S-box-containing protein